MLLSVTIACLALGATAFTTLGQDDHEEDKLLVTLFYESYCPGCIQYLGEQVIPAWKRFHASLVLDLVPFGNALQSHVDGHVKFDCQHGPKECVGNKLHACAIQQACGATGTKRCEAEGVSRALEYIHCLEQAPDQQKANDKCATLAQLKSDLIAKCASGEEGDRLLSLYGNQTTAFRPDFVPFVALDGKPNQKALDDLVGEICNARPQLCSHHTSI